MGTLAEAGSTQQEGPALRVEGSSVDAHTLGTSFDDLYRLHAAEAMQVARTITRNVDDAADAVAEAFAGVLGVLASGRLEGTDPLRPYVLAATRNAAIDIVRRSGRLTPTAEADALDRAASGVGPSDHLLAGEDRNLVGQAFADLPARWRAVLWLTEVEGMAPRDVGVLLGLTPNAAAQLAVRARSRLRQRYLQSHVRNHATGDCLDATERLGGLVAGELTTAQANRVRGHLAECAACRSRLSELEDAGLVVRRGTWVPALSALAYRLRHLRLRRWPRGRSRGNGRLPAAPPWAAQIDPAAVTTAGTVAQVIGSPAVQQLAGAVTAGMLVLGVGTIVVRHDQAAPRQEAAAPVAALPAPPTSLLPPLPATTTTTATAAAAPTPTTAAIVESTSTTTTTALAAVPPAAPAETARPPDPVRAAFTPRGPLATPERSLVAHALGSQLAVYDAPGATTARTVLGNPRPSGAPLTLLVVDQQPGWLDVLLPVRPNGSTGWIRSDQVSLVTDDFTIIVELGAHRITAYEGTTVLVSEPIGVGTAEAPTPGGLYYVTELFQPDDGPNGPYGPYAYGLSGHSDVLYDFAGGDGQFGIHGTNDPTGLGQNVSHGCIRMSNAGITRLAGLLPLGTPVHILA